MRWLADTQRALQAVERLQAKLKERGEVPTEEKLSLLKSVLQSPLFHQILALQKSVQQLRDQVRPTETGGEDVMFTRLFTCTDYQMTSRPHCYCRNQSYTLSCVFEVGSKGFPVGSREISK